MDLEVEVNNFGADAREKSLSAHIHLCSLYGVAPHFPNHVPEDAFRNIKSLQAVHIVDGKVDGKNFSLW